MIRIRILVAMAVLLAAGLITWLIIARKHAEADVDAPPTAIVTLARVKVERLQDIVSVYGTVQADPAGSTSLASPKAAIVTRVLVRSGQTVVAGQTMMELADAPG